MQIDVDYGLSKQAQIISSSRQICTKSYFVLKTSLHKTLDNTYVIVVCIHFALKKRSLLCTLEADTG